MASRDVASCVGADDRHSKYTFAMLCKACTSRQLQQKQQPSSRQDRVRIKTFGWGDHPRSRVDAPASFAQHEQEQEQEHEQEQTQEQEQEQEHEQEQEQEQEQRQGHEHELALEHEQSRDPEHEPACQPPLRSRGQQG